MPFEKYEILLKNSPQKQFGIFFIILVFMTWFMMECFFPGDYIHSGHDIHLHILRFRALIEALSDGRFPIYIDYEAIQGYGYPTKWFYPDILLVPFAFLAIISNEIFAYKTMMVTITLLSGVFMYIASIRVYRSSFMATISGLLYAFSVYRLQDLFERAALGESISITFIPLVFWGLYEIIKGDYKKWYIISIGFTLLIFSHVIATALTFVSIVIFLVIYSRSLLKEKKRIFYLILAGAVTTICSAYFLFPLLEQMFSNSYYYSTQIVFNIQQFTINPLFLYWATFGYTFFPNPYPFFLPGIGSLLTLLVCCRVFIREKSEAIKSVDIAAIVGFALILICLPIFPWGIYPFKYLEVIQFPWRFFEIVTYLFVIAASYYSARIVKSFKSRMMYLIFIIAASMLTTYIISYNCTETRHGMFTFAEPANKDNFYYQGTLEYAPAKIPSADYMEIRGDSIKTKYKDTEISDFTRSKGISCLDIKTNSKDESLELPLFYYKGYSAELNGKKIPIAESEYGLVEVSSIDESGRICVSYTGTTIQKISPFISLIGILSIFLYIYKTRKKKKT